MNRGDLQRLADTRVRDAVALMESRRYAGAYYLAGYAVESGLKACIAKRTRRHEFPDRNRANNSYSHDLGQLLRVAGLETQRDDDAAVDSVFARHWSVGKDWSEQSRYETKSRREAAALLNAITDSAHGVMQWLHRYW